MCTVSWTTRAGALGFELLCSRDELRTRLPASRPEVRALPGARLCAPRDGDRGGTWVGVNDRGLVRVLLNGPPAPGSSVAASAPAPAVPSRRGGPAGPAESGDPFRTRGELIPALAALLCAAELERGVTELPLGRYRPFVLVAVDAEGAAAVVRWDGLALAADPAAARERFLASSSFTGADVVAARRAEHAERACAGRLRSPEERLALHRSHARGPGPLSICMHRDDAGTVSLTSVRVDATHARMRYAPGPPCTTPLGAEVVLERV